MDSLITAAGRALAAGDPLGALKRVALRDDAPALALRGIAMAQLGDFVRAKALLKSAARSFGPKEAMARARCVVAEAEIALVSRDLSWPAKALDAARATLEAPGDPLNGRPSPFPGGPAPPPDGAPRPSRAHARRTRPRTVPACIAGRARTGGGGNRNATPPGQGGARSAPKGRSRRATLG